MGYRQFATNIPEYAHLSPKDYWDARVRGFGSTTNIPVTLISEEGLLGYPGDPNERESISIHELAHSIRVPGMARVDPSFDGRLKMAYDRAMAAGLWRNQYAATDHKEYFAEGAQSWFDSNVGAPANTRDQLIAYDPGLAALCREVFTINAGKYSRPASRLTGHLAGYNPITAPSFSWPGRLLGCLDNLDACRLSPPTTVQAESYWSMFGVFTENSSDMGGGQNVAGIEIGDWMYYPPVTIPITGTYRVSYRVAALNSGGSLQLEWPGGTPVYGWLSIPATGGWQTWTTISHIVTLSAGSQYFVIRATGSGWNINWFTLTKA